MNTADDAAHECADQINLVAPAYLKFRTIAHRILIKAQIAQAIRKRDKEWIEKISKFADTLKNDSPTKSVNSGDRSR